MLVLLTGFAMIVLSLSGAALACCYRKCAPGQALIISGVNAGLKGKSCRIVIGGGALVWPFIQQHAYLSLELMSLDLQPGTPVFTGDGVSLSVEAIAQVKVPATEEAIAVAAELFLTKSTGEIKSMAVEKLNDRLRSVIGTLKLEDVQFDYKVIGERLQAESAADFALMGLVVTFLSVKSLTPVSVNDILSIRLTAPETVT